MNGVVWPINGTDIFIVIALVVIFAYDAWRLRKNESLTISWRLAWWSTRAPIVAGVVGIIFGHLFWPNRFYCTVMP